ncbi:PLP-dependent aminotransferase family protein [Paenibacillus barcinonensis]|uniref:GntR family transcriptional regulator/MocR family aminotransferase n=1 Tax=Paenibacillus barcinonensis TaxID=198119 RepID=A0A2V4WKF1_PAEBA|nr:PLP-dependent aminotransferase family protein [Paenibacillus barcinonensis]PYE47964.1 GntR family transcriptional regulator/MocR family aminotransferase [Paenibacillus barcinonensis]QKS55086.1 PLP-dependent aminotransferase family protein [Paenibacillus barcinonensis]
MLKVNRKDARPIWHQLLDQAIHNITTGNWPPGELLLPSRELAAQIGVSRSTIQIVYEELFSRGYTVTSGRGGTRVSHSMHPARSSDVMPSGPVPPALPLVHESIAKLHGWFGDHLTPQPDIDFSPHEPYIDDTFAQSWRKAYLQVSAVPRLDSWSYGNARGYLPLREQIQRYLSLERGIHIDAQQILLTSGAQHSLDLIAQALLTEGDLVSVEDPGFPAAWTTMSYRQMKVAAVPVDEHGLCVEHIVPQSKLVFVTPSHQCAAGVIMSEPRRQQLIQLAGQRGMWIVEDDYDSEFRYRGEPLPPLFSQLPQNTLYMMSFSKMIAPGVRLSAIIGPQIAIDRLTQIQELTYRHLPIMEQLTLTHFIERGHFMRHMRRVRNIYRRRHEVMTKAIHSCGLSSRFRLSGVETGLHMLLEAEASYDEAAITAKALEQGVCVYPLSRYCLESNRKGWVLGFAKVDEDQIKEGILRFARLVL